jgi:hypothetical protein
LRLGLGRADGRTRSWRRVQAALEKFVQPPKNPERDGKAAWAKVPKETKEALKVALETKKFKEALETTIKEPSVVRPSPSPFPFPLASFLCLN